jgi:hypothetical protein
MHIGKTQLIMTFDQLQKLKEEKMESAGWQIECWNPFEIRHQDGSFATGQAAHLVMQDVCYIPDTEEEILETLVENGFPDGHKLQGDNSNKSYFVGMADMIYDDLVYVRGVSVDCIELIAKLAKIRCLEKAPKDTHQIKLPTVIFEEDKNV